MTARTKLLLMLGFFALPMLAAWLAYSSWHPDKHKNYGSLLAVTPLSQTQGKQMNGEPFNLDSLKGKWLMVYVGEAACDAACSKQLYYMRQSWISQGKDQERVERVWVVTDTGIPDPALLKSHPGLHVWRADQAAFLDQFSTEGPQTHHMYMVDPLGNLMMRFPANPDPKGMIKDMKLLLKASQIG